MDEIDQLTAETDALEASLGDAATMTAAFGGQLRDMQAALGATALDVDRLQTGFSSGLRNAFEGVVMDGMKLSDALGVVAKAMIDTTFAAAIRPVTDQAGAALASGVSNIMSGMLPFENGAPFSQGRVMPFAKGGVVSGATTFPMRGGTGLMGEAGPEAIMPLTRGADGSLGVRAAGGGGAQITMNITTPDVAGFERSRGQIAARMTRALGQGNRNR